MKPTLHEVLSIRYYHPRDENIKFYAYCQKELIPIHRYKHKGF